MIELDVPADARAQLFLLRKYFTDQSTVGEFSIDHEFNCHILEDTCRRAKIQNETAIPSGIYRVILDYSDRFGFSPLILGVKGFTFIRMHTGNTKADTAGCLLVGKYDERYPDVISDSRIAYAQLMPKLEAMNKKEKLFIQISGGTPMSDFRVVA